MISHEASVRVTFCKELLITSVHEKQLFCSLEVLEYILTTTQ